MENEEVHLYRVFEIGEISNERSSLSDEQEANIDEIFDAIVNDNLNNQNIKYTIPNSRIHDASHPIVHASSILWGETVTENTKDLLAFYLADLLLKQELMEDGDSYRRKKTIKEGILFIKIVPESITLMKLEETSIINRDSFQLTRGLSIDQQYYKICIVEQNALDEILIVDRNKKVAKYWANDFLQLERVRDSYTNTLDFIELLENDTLFSEQLDRTSSEYKNLKRQAREFISTNTRFELEELFQDLEFSVHTELDSESFLSRNATSLFDANFSINSIAIRDHYKKTFSVSPSITIKSKDIFDDIASQNIYLEGNVLKIDLHNEYVAKVEELFDEYKV